MSTQAETPLARTISSVAVRTHRRREVTADALRLLIEAAERAGVELRFDEEEAAKHGVEPSRGGPGAESDADLCIVLGGDGTTLRSLRAFAGTDVPVFSVNCGQIGFLATADREQIPAAFARALSGQFELVRLAALVLQNEGRREFAVNEVSFQRGANMNVAHLSYSLAGEEVARAPCDGLIASTPAGSTAYNLSAGGPILAWKVNGFVVTMVAPHALGTRAVVAAPDDLLVVANEGDEAVDVVIDGTTTDSLGPGQESEVRFRQEAVGLAQLPGTSVYSRLRERLGMLTA